MSRFSSSFGPAIPANPFGTRHIPVGVDPPLHSTYRRVLNTWFSKAEVTRREPDIATLVTEIVTGLAERGSWDFVSDLADVSPGAVTLGILGWDRSRREELLEVMARGLRNQASTDPSIIEQNAAGNRWIREQILLEAEDRRTHPRADLMTVLATEPIVDGEPMSDEEVSDTVVFLLLAGFHTTSGALTALLVQMAREPALHERLVADRDLIPAAIDEVIRIYTPVTAVARRVTEDTHLGEVGMRTGDWALFVNMAANHDPAAFPDPERIDLDRERSKSVAFGWGVHRCMGLHLARLVLRLEVEAVLDLLPGHRIDLDRTVRSEHVGVGFFYRSVPAVLPGR
ncbi:cytochrome P450 [Rhodococcus sp. T7]|uniref:cytochrome P450 n=1 Tax=Rhodococcus sp. T7 TaxID=627444 RepID=UPI00135C92C6|nr:cytochrome P450 [Rhodococcus sp. T7]KAF0962821.1 Steroid C26-monooxygenase [Rhodococcus sp. T7]